ncbi:MAG: glycoside hydrolase family 3 N-terminal domain-containing protein, partial [Bacteroidota bacterium]
QALTPVLDVSREPRWGRTEETYGEDPYLASEIGLAAIYGFQGRSGKIDENHVVATLKHLSGHGQPESGTNIAPANISRRVLREVFLYPFKKAVMEGGAKSVMPSYNEIDGVPSHGSSWLFETILRGEWGFNGTVVSDYGAVHELHGRHRIAKDHEDAAIKAMTIGVDMELPDPTAYPLLKAAIEGGRMDEKILDRSVKRILRHKFELGLFDKPFADPKKAERVVGSVEHMAFSQKVAEESIILLQNKNQLAPLSLGKKPRIALIGPNADVELQGGYSSVPKHFVTVKQGIEAYVGDKAEVRYAKGCGITEPGSWYLDPVERTDEAKDRKLIAEAVEVAQASDVIILAIGGNELTSREAWVESHMGDRTDLQMVGLQDDLVDALAATGKPILALLFNGRPLAVNNLVEKADAIFECWYLGQETGHAVARVIFGEVNPSGKLPITIPRSVGHVPAYYNHKPTARRGYLFDDVSPLWAFGEGMSYTTFSLSNPRLIKDNIKTYGSSAVEINVSNTGKMDGAEVVQMYVRDEYSSVTRPVMELKGFQKVFLKAGESKTVRIPIEHESLAFYNDKMEYVVEPGSFDIMLGTSSQSADLQHIRLTVQ